MKSEEIYYITNKEIDKSKWDKSINLSYNGVIYAYSWYLDIVAEHWDALVNKDYSIVFPLTFKKKFGIYYLCQPPFTQQLGIFSLNKLTPDTLSLFLNKIPDKFKLIEINLNLDNNFELTGFSGIQRITYLLNLNDDYKILRKRYSENTARNIKKADKNGIKILVENENIDQLIDFFINTTLKNDSNTSAKTFSSLKKLVITTLKKNKGQFYIAHDIQNNLCGCAFFINDTDKAIFLFSSANIYARESGVMHKLIDTFIKNNSSKNIILDFEGSMIAGVARFYKSFGAEKFTYLHIKKNNFPKLISWLK
jgi:hypothetical protein